MVSTIAKRTYVGWYSAKQERITGKVVVVKTPDGMTVTVTELIRDGRRSLFDDAVMVGDVLEEGAVVVPSGKPLLIDPPDP